MIDPPTHAENHDFNSRLRFMGCATLLILVVGWVGWFSPFDDLLDRSGTPLGADYAMFYVAGQVVLDGAAERLYDQAEHQQRLQALFPGLDERFCLPYRYPPHVATLMVPLASLPYAASYGVFLLLSCGLCWGAMRLLLHEVPRIHEVGRASVGWAIAGWPVVLETLIGGQAAMFALGIAVGTWLLLRRQQFVLAGAVLALAAYKPNVLALLACGCLVRYPQMWRGLLPVGCLIFLLSLVPAGWTGIVHYRELSMSLALEPWDVATPAWKVHGLAPWLERVLPGQGRTVGGLLGLVMTIAISWRVRGTSRPAGDIDKLWFATLVSINVLFNAYTPIYDLVLLVIGVLLTCEYLAERGASRVEHRLWLMQGMLVVFYLGPHLSQATAKLTGVQPFALVLLASAMWQTSLLWQARCRPLLTRNQLLTSVSR